jgi:hypothetical protein
MKDFSLKLGESSVFIAVTDDYNKPLRPDIDGYCSIGDKSGVEVKRIQLERVPKINPETNQIDGYILLFQVTPKLSLDLGVGKYKYGIYIFTKHNGEINFFKEFETGSITIKETFVHQSKETFI